MILWHHPIRAIWQFGRDAQHALAARCVFALVALGLLLSGSVIPCRLIAAQMQSEEMPDSQSPAEEASEILVLATGHQRREGKVYLHVYPRSSRSVAALQVARCHSASSRASLRSRSGELLAHNGCGAALRC